MSRATPADGESVQHRASAPAPGRPGEGAASEGTRRGRATWAWPLAFLLVLVAYLAEVARFDFVCDDAYISFRYARHLAEGVGLRFNAGEEPPVEGFSNFLWVLVLGGTEALGLPSPVASRVLSVAAGVCLLALLLHVLRRRMDLGPLTAAAVGLFVALFPPFAVWSTSGLAMLPFALGVFAAFELLLGGGAERSGLGRAAWAGACALGVALLRTEGILWALGIGGLAVLSWLPRERRAFARRARPYAVVLLAGFGLFLLWRHAYFGAWISNTARAKGELDAFTLERGLAYSVSFLLDVPSAMLLLVLATFTFARGATLRAWLALAMVLGAFAFATAVGGDFMPFYRFFVVAVPFLALVLAELMKRGADAGGGWRIGAALLPLAAIALSLLPQWEVSLFPDALRERARFRWSFFAPAPELVSLGELDAWERSRDNCASWILLGKALDAVGEPGESIALGPIGAVGYHSRLEILDLGGLIDPRVGARPRASLRRSPGHDQAVTLSWFADTPPTYAFARLTRRRPNLRAHAERLFAEQLAPSVAGDMGRDYELAIVGVGHVEGFEEDEVLLLGRRTEAP